MWFEYGMFDNKNGEDPEDDNDTLRYCDPTGVGGTCIFTLIAVSILPG